MSPEELANLERWHQVLDDSDYYEILGVLELVDPVALRGAFHDFSRRFHPDGHLSESEAVRELVSRVFQRGAEAYRVLSDPETRLRYDMGLERGHLRLSRRDSSQVPAVREDVRPLHELCRSAGAKLCAMRADKHFSQGELAAAQAELERALEFDGGTNPALQERLEALGIVRYAQGD